MVVHSSSYTVDRLPGVEAFGRSYSRPLSVGRIAPHEGDGVVGEERYLHEEHSALTPKTYREFDNSGREDALSLLQQFDVEPDSGERFYRLSEVSGYLVTFAEETTVPEGHVGYVTPRETLLAVGATLSATAVGPAEDHTSAVLRADDRTVLLAEGASIAELVAVEATDL